LLSRLLHECETAKRKLSASESAVIRFPQTDGTIDESSEKISIESAQLNEWTSNLLAKTRLPLQRALSDAGLTRHQVDEIIMVGGATRMPQIKGLLKETFGKEPRCTLDPDLVVAMGAAIQGGLVHLDKAVTDMVVTDVAPFTLGVEIAKDVAGSVRGGYFFPVISRNTTIPISRVEQFSTIGANQTSVTIRLYQGEGRRIEDNLFLGEFELKGIPRGPAGQQVDVRFTYDLNGILEVEAVAAASGIKATYVVTRHAQNMSGTQLKEALQNMQNLKSDPREDQANRHLLKKADRLYRELPVDLKKHLEMLIHGFEEALQLQDPSGIELNRTALEEFINRFDESA
jgi:molecular chaperone HscC